MSLISKSTTEFDSWIFFALFLSNKNEKNEFSRYHASHKNLSSIMIKLH